MKIQFKPSALSLDSWSDDNKSDYELLSNGIVRREKNRSSYSTYYCLLREVLYILAILTSLFSIFVLCKFIQSLPTYELIGTIQFEDVNSDSYEVDISWSKCGTDEYGKINLLEVSPNPISLHKNLIVSLEADVFKNVDSPLKIEVKVEKKFWFKWIKIPCIDMIGSCTYPDACQLSPYIHNSSCVLPIPDSHLPCKCPIKEGRYYANKSVIHVKDPAKYIPKWLKNGKYYVRVNGFLNETKIGCYEFWFAVRT